MHFVENILSPGFRQKLLLLKKLHFLDFLCDHRGTGTIVDSLRCTAGSAAVLATTKVQQVKGKGAMMFLRAQELFKNSIDRSYAVLSRISRILQTGNQVHLSAVFVQNVLALWRQSFDQSQELAVFHKLTPFFQYLYTAPLENPPKSLRMFFENLPPELHITMPTYETFLLKFQEVEDTLIAAFQLDRSILPQLLPKDTPLSTDKAA